MIDQRAAAYVRRLPRRTAHATHALLYTTRELRMPATAAEVCIYDEEALTAACTAAALREAARRGLCVYTGVNNGRYWVASAAAEDLRRHFERRYLKDTARNEDEAR